MEAFGDECTSSRINPSFANEDIVKLSKGYTEVYDNMKPQDHKQYQNPPNVNPRMISYNLHSKANTPTYSQVASNHKTPQVIQPTYTEIDWKKQMEAMQKETISQCRQITQDMITEANLNLSQEMKIIINTHKEESETKFATLLTSMTNMTKTIMEHVSTEMGSHTNNTKTLITTDRLQLRPHSPLIDNEKRKQGSPPANAQPLKKPTNHQSTNSDMIITNEYE